MSQNPYESGGPEGGSQGAFADEFGYAEPSRTSALAIVSLVTSFICCIPGLGVVAMLLGIISLITIGSSHGRVTGRGAALAGIIIGLAVSAIQGAIGFGVLQGATFYTKQMQPAAFSFFESAGAGDYGAARQLLHSDAEQSVSDEDITRFYDTTQRLCGELAATQGGRGLSDEFGFLMEAFAAARQNFNNQQVNVDPSIAPVPVAIETDQGPVLTYIFFHQAGLQGASANANSIADILVFVPGSDDAITLRADGPARQVALASGIADEDIYLSGVTPQGADGTQEQETQREQTDQTEGDAGQ
jgi:hypothetical protein